LTADCCLTLVYAIEASTMSEQAALVVQSNAMHDRITVLHGRIEVTKLTLYFVF